MVEGLKIRSTRSLLLFGALVSAVACARSGTLASDDLDCGTGWRVFFQYGGHCVYPTEGAPEMCPKSVPHRYQLSTDVVCSEDPELRQVAGVTIAARGRAQQDAGTDRLAAVDGGVTLPPTMTEPVDPPIVDGQEPDGADVDFAATEASAGGFADSSSSPEE